MIIAKATMPSQNKTGMPKKRVPKPSDIGKGFSVPEDDSTGVVKAILGSV